MKNRPIAELPNLGPKSAEWLRAVGIDDERRLREVGPVVAYLRVQASGVSASKNLLWALHAAITGDHWTDITPADKAALEAELRELRGE